MRIPYGMTVHGEEEIEAVVRVLRSSTQMGKHVREFEQKVSALLAKKHGVMVNSGSSANYLAVELLGMKPGSEVITPVLTFGTTVAPIVKNNLLPVFVDVEEGTYNIDVGKIKKMISKKTKALMIPNLLGNFSDWALLKKIADEHKLLLIEDSCDTLGATLHGRPTGAYTDISTTSFYGSHIINCAGNGGMLCLNNHMLAQKAQVLRSWGRSSSVFVESEQVENRFNCHLDDIRYDAKFVFEEVGYNFEPSELGAAFGLVQLKKLTSNIAAREKHVKELSQFFKPYEKWFILPRQCPESQTGWLAYPLTVKKDAPFTRTDMQIFLEKRDIQTRVIFTGNVLKQPGYKSIKRKEAKEGYPVADQVMRGGILIGCHQGLDEKMMAYLKSTLKEFLDQF